MNLIREFSAEFIGTFIIVFFGTGSVHAAVLTHAQSGIWQVAIVWGIAVALAIYAAGSTSAAHFNPAVTIAFGVFRGFPLRKIPFYICFQIAGAITAASVLYLLFKGAIMQFETGTGIIRGAVGSEQSAMIFADYFPNPATIRMLGWPAAVVSTAIAMTAEFLGTAFLCFFIFALTDKSDAKAPGAMFAPLFIGLTVSIIISVIGPVTGAGLNPARDFGPRLFAYFAGWRTIAIPGPRGGFLAVYILAPILGALWGAAVHSLCFTRFPSRILKGRTQVKNTSEPVSTAINVRRWGMKNKPKLIIVGGFLGAGKTTLLWKCARILNEKGLSVGLITNDQAPDLVDTALLNGSGAIIRELSGSCFCCNFNGFIDIARKLADNGAQIIIAEPVGSCTDLSATIMQPLKLIHREFELAPLSILADPSRALEALTLKTSGMHPDALYILQRQLAEADRIIINKSDVLKEESRQNLLLHLAAAYPETPVRVLSARDGMGVDEWLQEMLTERKAGIHIADIDYDRYAHGEAVLGWLNATVHLTWKSDPDLQSYLEMLLVSLKAEFKSTKAEIGHVKMFAKAPGLAYVGNLTSFDQNIVVRPVTGSVPNSDCSMMILNARVQSAPETLERIVRTALDRTSNELMNTNILSLRCFAPGRPRPTHRYDHVI